MSVMDKWRKPSTYLGPASVGTVLGQNIFESADELRTHMEQGYYQKVTPALQKGICREGDIRALYERQTGARVAAARFVVDKQCPRFGGICDGLVGLDGGIEIKCVSGEPKVYDTYVSQAISYMYLYGRKWWDIVICHLPESAESKAKLLIHRLHWNAQREHWETYMYPRILDFISSVRWTTQLK